MKQGIGGGRGGKKKRKGEGARGLEIKYVSSFKPHSAMGKRREEEERKAGR